MARKKIILELLERDNPRGHLPVSLLTNVHVRTYFQVTIEPKWNVKPVTYVCPLCPVPARFARPVIVIYLLRRKGGKNKHCGFV